MKTPIEDHFPEELGFLGGEGDPRIFNKFTKSDFDDMSYLEYNFYISNGKELPNNKYYYIYEWMVKNFTYNDIKIWPNRIAGYSGASQNSDFATVSAALCSMESKIMGYRPFIKAYNMLMEFNKLKANYTIKEISKKVIPYGFGRPQFGQDERVILFKEKFLDEKILKDFPTLKMAFEIEKELNGNLFLNYGGLVAAFIIDYGVTGEEYHRAHSLIFAQVTLGIKKFVLDNTPKQHFLPVSSNKIIYEGDYEIGRKWEND